ncbi:MAG: hypothetical protein ACFFCQ_13080 [Promethearchaeota archaeon]
MKLAKLAAQTGLYPLCEWEDGKLIKVRRFPKFKPVEEFLKPQRRFAHLFRPGAEEALKSVQEYANNMIDHYGLKR